MSDFLRNLAARSLGRLDVVHPHRPSRYEPAQIGSGSPDGFTVDEVAARVVDPGAPPQPERSTSPPDLRARPSVSVNQTSTPATHHEPMSHVPLDDLVEEGMTGVREPSSHQAPRRSPSGTTENIPATPEPRSGVQADGPFAVEEAHEYPQQGRGSGLQTGISNGPDRTNVRGRNRRPSPASATQGDGPGTPVSQLPHATAPREAPDRRGGALPPVNDEPWFAEVEFTQDQRDEVVSPAAPARGAHTSEFETWPELYQAADQKPGDDAPIRVTIGRIDVRATNPAPPQARPRPARPRPQLSLADYLKQRTGGG